MGANQRELQRLFGLQDRRSSLVQAMMRKGRNADALGTQESAQKSRRGSDNSARQGIEPLGAIMRYGRALPLSGPKGSV